MVGIGAAVSARPDAAFTLSFAAATFVFVGENARV
jgi:hypothetical protein